MAKVKLKESGFIRERENGAEELNTIESLSVSSEEEAVGYSRVSITDFLRNSGFVGEQENTADRQNLLESLSVSSEEEADAKDEEEVTGLGKAAQSRAA
jgi:hypothetical protein